MAKTSGSPLNRSEKYSIVGMLADNLSVKDMSKHLGRSQACIKKYIENELSNTAQLVEETKDKIDPEVAEKVINTLVANGMKEFDAQSSLNRVRMKLINPCNNVDELITYCARLVSPKDMMITKAAGGRKGVAVMTQGASMKMDDLKNKPPTNRVARNAIYKQNGEII